MNFFRRHSYLITAALVLVLLPLPLLAADPQDPALLFILKTLHSFVVAVFGLFVWLGALLLEFSINNFVIGFGDTYSKSGVGVAVDTTWIIIRDFVNMGFIFGFVYIGFKMILNSNDSNTRRLLINILMAALLVNFSLFATKFVVDLSNQLAAQIAVNGLSEEIKVVDKKTGLPKLDLAGALTQRMGVQGALSDGKNGLPQGAGFSYIIGVAVLFLVTAFVFAAGGILLSIRFAMLTFFLMISPVMFLNWALPLVKKDTMSEYWSQFLGKAFFAPIYLLMIYFSFRVMSGMQTSIGAANGATNLANPDWAGTFQMVEGASPTSSALGTVPFFVLICIFMIMSLVVAQRLGMEGGSKALSIGKSLKNKVQRGVTNTGKFAAAQTGGRAARATSEWAGGKLEGGLRRAQQLQGTGDGARAIRAIARMNGVQGAVGGAAESMQKAKFGMSKTRDEDRKLRQQTETRSNNSMDITTGLRSQELLDAVKTGKIKVDNNGVIQEEDLATMTDERKQALGLTELTSTDDTIRKEAEKKHENQSTKMQRVAADMSIKDFEAMSEDEQEKIAEYISGPLSESVMKSDNISEAQKGKIGKAQKEAIEKVIRVGGELLTEKIAGLSIRQIETMGDEFVAEHAAHFTDSQFSDIKKSKKFTEGQTGRFIGKRKADLLEMVKDESTAGRAFTQSTGPGTSKARKSSEIAKLPGEVLAKPNSTRYITVDVLKAIASGDKDFERVSTEDREMIEKNITDANRNTLGNDPTIKKAFDYLKSIQGQERFFGQR